MKILVTGSYGQLGSEIKELSTQFPGWDFLFTDVDTLDITNYSEVQEYFKKNEPDFVVNCAAYTAVDKAEQDQEMAKKVNSLAPQILGKISKENNAIVIHISTDYVFDGTAIKPYAEKDMVNPQGVYGVTKLEGEENCLAENPNSLVIRTSWLYSTFGNNFVKTMIRLGKDRGELKVVYDQIGTPTNAADLADAILKIIQSIKNTPENFKAGIYHYSNEGVASWYDFALAIFEIAGIDCNVKPVLSEEFPTPAKRPNYSVLNKSKIKNQFNVVIPYWKDSLKNCVEKLEK